MTTVLKSATSAIKAAVEGKAKPAPKAKEAKATEVKTATAYRFALPKETKVRAETYIVPKGPMGKERWLSKANYKVTQEGDKLIAMLTPAQHDYWVREGITGMTPVEQ